MGGFPEEVAIDNLKGIIAEGERGYMTRQEALDELRELSGKDFGIDIDAWDKWVKQRMRERFDNFGSK